jgi:hypothetical protein
MLVHQLEEYGTLFTQRIAQNVSLSFYVFVDAFTAGNAMGCRMINMIKCLEN